jgi:hypothetical protein
MRSWPTTTKLSYDRTLKVTRYRRSRREQRYSQAHLLELFGTER